MPNLMIKRIQKDLKELHNSPLHNIYFHIDETNIKLMHFMIIGPSETPYEHGFFVFKLEIPNEYPFKPPHVTYLSTNGNIRFHPFLYENGKVCLSLLNTWAGPQWTSIQTLRSILMSIQSIFSKQPLLDEPGHQHDCQNKVELYNRIIEYYKYDFSILNQLNKKVFPFFYEQQKNYFNNNFNDIQSNIKNLIKTIPTKLPELFITKNSYVEIKYTDILNNIDINGKFNTQIIYLNNLWIEDNEYYKLMMQIKSFDSQSINIINNISMDDNNYTTLYVKILNYAIVAPYPFSKMSTNFEYDDILKKLNYLKENLYI